MGFEVIDVALYSNLVLGSVLLNNLKIQIIFSYKHCLNSDGHLGDFINGWMCAF